MTISEQVDELLKAYNTNCPFKLAKFLGIQIVHEQLGNTLGYYNRRFRVKVIHINENLDEYRKIFVCAHELGHALLHPEANTPFLKTNTFFSTEKIEREANEFAVHLLFSKENGHISEADLLLKYGLIFS